ncbi:hypothetical protein Patl1_06403 [Pistacia atlantica]|uniref:Uncharacterized protein n=1 Tax=Pistacia atlantica TaxID=434234 RepID=A0ACC1BSD8_9ROSI|nr:hypothetical protein Patl1_06403 [Pistacia atlantica]
MKSSASYIYKHVKNFEVTSLFSSCLSYLVVKEKVSHLACFINLTLKSGQVTLLKQCCYHRFRLVLNEAMLCLVCSEPRGFAFVQFVDPYDAAEAQHHMNGKRFAGREISVVVAAETRKRPEEMRHRARVSGGSSYDGPRSSYYGRSRSRSVSRSRSPRHPQGSRGRYRSRSYSPVPRQHEHYSVSPRRRHAEHPRSPRGPPQERVVEYTRRSYSPAYDDAADRNHGNDYVEKAAYEEGSRAHWRAPPGGGASRSPSGSRSRSADLSPRRSR